MVLLRNKVGEPNTKTRAIYWSASMAYNGTKRRLRCLYGIVIGIRNEGSRLST